MGYDYIVFDEHHFNEDLQWVDAVPMFERLQALADSKGLEFGLKLSNTFPVDTTRNELPGTEMYMSGRSLFPLTIEMCNRISRQFNGKMRISFAGGAEFFNCDKLFAAGIWPITVATTILKPGGYNRLHQMVEKTEKLPYKAFCGTDSSAISDMSTASHSDFHHLKPIKPVASRKSEEKFLGSTASRPPARAAARSIRTSPNTSSSAARASMVLPSSSSPKRTRFRLSPAPSALTAARTSARATSMKNLSRFATPSSLRPRRATAH